MRTLVETLKPMGQQTRAALGALAPQVTPALEQLQGADASARIWGRNGSLWASKDRVVAREVEDRLGWLDLPRDMRLETPRLQALASEVRSAGITRVVLLGMGGSSLAPETMVGVLPRATDGCELVILDSTDPTQIRRVEAQAPLAQTLFILASKSGTTAETDSLYAYFKSRLIETVGEDAWSGHFIAITDPDTRLATLAIKEQFRALYINPPDIGGRYSALSLFGLVPAALAGVDIDQLLLAAQEMAWSCRGTIPEAENPGLVLGAIMGAAALAQPVALDKLTLLTSPSLAAFGPWAEQLIAESTGKAGVGILPVEGEDLSAATTLSNDRLYVYMRLESDDNALADALALRLTAASQPLVMLSLADRYDLGGELFRWELATAVAGQLLGINPFDQPDVESAKISARKAIEAYAETQRLEELPVVLAAEGLAVSGPALTAADLPGYFGALLGKVGAGQYVAIMAYIDRSAENDTALQRLRDMLVRQLVVPVTVGFGPRFLHSTGQLHKGGPNTGLFIQLVQEETADLGIPERGYSFGVLKAAQALGDWQALEAAGRTAVRVNLGSAVAAGLDRLVAAVQAALA